jgi:single-strand DNA-binding protein
MINKATIMGHLGRDPETRTFENGGKVTNLRIATTEKWKDRNTGERREATEWHSVAVFGPLADVAADYLRKGSLVYLEGKIVTRKWQDQSGNDRYSTEIQLNGPQATLKLMPSGNRGGPPSHDHEPDGPGAGYDPGGKHGGPAPAGDIDDEIPF